MRKFYSFRRSVLYCVLTLLITTTSYSQGPPVIPQSVKISDFSLFAGSNNNLPADSSNYGITFFSVGKVFSGDVGSRGLIQLDYNNQIYGNVYSNHRIRFGDTGQIFGNVIANNFTGSTVPAIVSNNSYSNTFQNLIAQGNISLNINNSVKGQVSIPQASTYTGPTPQGGTYKGNFGNVPMPVMPLISPFNPGSGVINTTTTISPGSYKSIELSGGQTVTFAGPGDYYFDSIKNLNTGGPNIFNYDFLNTSTGLIRIIILQHAELGQIQTTTAGGDGSRIYTEVQGVALPGRRNSFTIDGQSGGSNWKGTVWAPYGAIYIGTSYGQGSSTTTMINGALWSGFYIYLDKAVFIYHVPLVAAQSVIAPYYPPPAGGKVSEVIGSELNSLANNYNPTSPDTSQNIFLIFPPRGLEPAKVMIEAIAQPGQYSALLSYLQANGLTNIISNGAGNTIIITGRYPIDKLRALNTQTSLIRFARPLYQPLTNGGLVTTQGDSAMRSGLVRRGFNVSGAGVKVGIMSDSYNTVVGNHAAADVLNGDLPGPANPDGNLDPVDVLGEYPFADIAPRLDEGRAMAQIVHDIAPKAKLAFRTGFLSAGDFAEGIKALADSNCKVIVEDITYITEPFFKDGVVAKAVDNVVTNKGVTYFSSAGNFGVRSHESVFDGTNIIPLPTGIITNGFAHQFAPGQITQNIILPVGTYTIVLQWEDDVYSIGGPSTGTQNDMDVYLVDATGSSMLFGYNRNNIGGDPIEVLPFTVEVPSEARVVIVRAAGSTNVRFKYIIFRGAAVIAEYNSGTSTLVGQANATNAIAVGAALFSNTPAYNVNPATIASFSSRGGTPVDGAVRNKPEIVAPNGVNTTVDFGSTYNDGDIFPNFFGTSASAPHAAAVAALLIEGKKKFFNLVITPAELKTLLQSTASNMGVAGYDVESGSGLIQADAAMRTFAKPTPGIISLERVGGGAIPPPGAGSAFDLKVLGENLSRESKIYLNGVPITASTTVTGTNEARASIPDFTGNPSVQLYTPPTHFGSDGNPVDGGLSNSVNFVRKPLITVKANDAHKKYGEANPAFSSTIKMDGHNLPPGVNATTLGLDGMQYKTPASTTSNVNYYFIQPVAPATLHTDSYDYEFSNGVLTVEKLPLKITPDNKTLKYGEFPTQITFKYDFDASNMNDIQKAAVLNEIKTEHRKHLADNTLAVVNGFNAPVSGGTVLSARDLDNMSMLASYQAFRNARRFYIQDGVMKQLVNNVANGDIGLQRLIVDLSAQSLANYRDILPPAAMPMATSLTGQHRRAVLSAQAMTNRTAFLSLDNGQTMGVVNGQTMGVVNDELKFFNGQTMGVVNGQCAGMVNGEFAANIDGQVLTLVNPDNKAVINGQLIANVDGQLRLVENVVPIANSANLQVTVSGGATTTIAPNKLNAVVDGQVYNVTNVQISNGQTMGLVNGQTMGLVNGQTMGVVNGQSMGMVNTGVSDGPNSNRRSAIIVDQDDIDLQQGMLGSMMPVNMITGFELGAQYLIPGTLSLDNYDITYGVGNVNIVPQEITITADAKQKTYGEADPALTYKITSGALVGSDAVAGALQRVPGGNAGNYLINQGTLALSSNYTLSYVSSQLTINPAPLTITADLKYIDQGASLPTFTSTVQGLKGADAITGILYSARSVNTSVAGVYDNFPSLPGASYPNYAISFFKGLLYVNPYGPGTKKVKTKLDCVEQTGRAGFNYVAHFSYENKNSTAFYVPIGPDNKITTAGSYSGNPPVVFNPGSGTFVIPFDGSKLTWTLTTKESGKKTAVASDASSSSNRCNANGITATEQSDVTEVLAAIDKSTIRPNPVQDKLILNARSSIVSNKDITIVDVSGRAIPTKSIRRVSGTVLEIDLSGLQKGVYFLSLRTKEGLETFRFVKL